MAEEKNANSTEESTQQAQTEQTPEASEGFGLPASGEDTTPSYQQVADQLDEDAEVDKVAADLESQLSDEELAAIADASDEELEKLIDKSEEGEEPETSESEEESSESPEEETDEIEEILSNRAQKRIDKLTAEKKSSIEENELLKAKIAELETKVNSVTEKKTPQDEPITDEQLARAINKGIEENDATVIVDAINYVAERTKKQTIKEQQEAQAANAKKLQAQQAEWQSITEDYSPKTYQLESLKVDPDFNISNPQSKLFRLADAIYKKNGYQSVEKGQTRAAREAYSILLERKLAGDTVPKKDETEGLKNRLGKEQRKTRPLSGANSVGDTKPKEITSENELEDYVKSRNKGKELKLGIDI